MIRVAMARFFAFCFKKKSAAELRKFAVARETFFLIMNPHNVNRAANRIRAMIRR